ncbi:hypothetical protein TeGR_g9228 [Tetraparma gracilis]|uniref:Uncharacterized protein n=1 Tax=Tetraparma gracilis TaxID=2962635 RepID=A0ABQ6N158_9STRA|nr:hypothetical protein TeGR_g9228 [Tetraparma gracilis]
MPEVGAIQASDSIIANYPVPPPDCVHFEPLHNNTRSELQLSFTGTPASLTGMWRRQGYFALNFESPTSRSLIEIPIEIATSIQKINAEIPMVPNFPLMFWALQLSLLAVSVLGLLAGGPVIFIALLVPSLLIPYFVLRSFVGSLVLELRRLSVKYSETYFLRVKSTEWVPFWKPGAGFLYRQDAFMVAMGLGLRIYAATELEYGAPMSLSKQSSVSGPRLMSKRAKDNKDKLETIKKDNLKGDMMTQMQTGRNKSGDNNHTDMFAAVKNMSAANNKVEPVGGGPEAQKLGAKRGSSRATRARGSLPQLDIKELENA